MTDATKTLDLNKLTSGADSHVAAMLAELEGRPLCMSEAGVGRTLWTHQFEASGKGLVIDA